jgi:hypothetical protein
MRLLKMSTLFRWEWDFGDCPNTLIPKDSTSSEGGLSYSLFSGKGKQQHPDHPVNPVQ